MSRLPVWERRYPGLMAREYDALKAAGVEPVPNSDALAQGRLILDFDWRVDVLDLGLQALYPESFPRMQPVVRVTRNADQLPRRHRTPETNVLCLLGPDSAQWVPEMTLAQLLREQLPKITNPNTDEEPQGEPTEVWWNSDGLPEAYCLVDTAWSAEGRVGGYLRLKYSATGSTKVPLIRAYVEELQGADKFVANWESARPPTFTSEMTIPWKWLEEPVYPNGGEAQIHELLRQHFGYLNPVKLSSEISVQLAALAYPSELELNEIGTGWLFLIRYGPSRAFYKAKENPRGGVLRTYRAGLRDLGTRVPAVSVLRTKKVALVGLGSVGAPIALELARNGVRQLHVVEYDTVEPGNSVRWPFGVPSWGMAKVAAVRDYLGNHFPLTEVIAYQHRLGAVDGNIIGDDQLLTDVLREVDAVIDASGSYGVRTLVGDYAREARRPLITTFATPTVEGGVVALFVRGSGCPLCYEVRRAASDVPLPLGLGDETTLLQPPGCGDRTFTGAAYDLLELSLESVRLLMEVLDGSGVSHSKIETLGLRDTSGARIPPQWIEDLLHPVEGCECRSQ